MKTRISFFLFSLFFTIGTMAQVSTNDNIDFLRNQKKMIDKISAKPNSDKLRKSSTTDERLIAQTIETTHIADSGVYVYTGTRGSVLDEWNIDFEDNSYDRLIHSYMPSGVLTTSNRTYNANDQKLVQLDSTYDGSAWEPNYKDSSVYNANGELITRINMTWYASSMTWGISTWREYEYIGGKLDVIYQLSFINSVWVPAGRWKYNYVGNNLTEIHYDGKIANVWQPYSRSTYTYNANNQVLTFLYETYQNNLWKASFREITSYNAGAKPILVLYEGWANSQWVNGDKDTITWIGNRISTMENQDWNITLGWVKVDKSLFTYNSNGYPTIFEKQVWNGTAFVFDPASGSLKKRYYYETYNNIGINDVKTKLIGVKYFPNPVQNNLSIEIENNAISNYNVLVLDIKGKIVATSIIAKNTKNTQFSVSHLSSGNYIIQLRDENGILFSDKMTKQ